MGQLLEYIKMALKNIRSNKGRSFLTMLGIIIGISSVIMIISIGNGVSGSISDQLNSIAGGQVAVYSNSNEEYDAVTFDDEDITAIEEQIDHVKGATFTDSYFGTALGPKGNFSAYANAGNEALKYTAQEAIVEGTYFTEADVENAAKVCVLRESGAMSLFGTTDVIGKTFEITMGNNTVELRIVGIRADNASALLNAMNYYEQVELEMPITTFGQAFYDKPEEYGVIYIIGEPEYSKEIASAAINLMEIRHKVKGQGVILMESFSDQMSSITSVISTITVFIVFVAAISLLVGGIGVMNIMLVSVTERTREIGIRKALGARTRSILLQFLFESAIITLLGGLIGIALGALLAFIICTLMGFQAKVSLVTVLIASLFSSAVGIFFGIYPARRAAKLSPIEALRHE
ncbi:MAG: ABC transporter permease [Lachnospiraceae bacterium]|nr:ABC transporter permease [Lachnospiraceae bacterium]